MGTEGSSGRHVRKRNGSVTCEAVRALYSGSSACSTAETLEALLEQMTSPPCFIHQYHKANLSPPFKCAHSRAHASLSPSSSLFLTHTHTHTAVRVVFWQECTYTNSNYLRCWGGRAERPGGSIKLQGTQWVCNELLLSRLLLCTSVR